MTGKAAVVLIVDDHEAARFAKGHVLRRAGFDVVEAATGQAGLEAAASRSPDVVVLDVNLPDISGFEVARRLKANAGDGAASPILQVSSTAVATADRVRGLEGGADVYLTEPVAGEVLVATVRALLRVRHAEQALAAALAREREARGVAEDASRLKDQFIATLSHELRTPLNAVMGWIYQLRHSQLDESTRNRALDSLERNARLQVQLINDLLDISRIARGKLHLRMCLVDLWAVVNETVDSVRSAAARKHLALSFSAKDACWVVADAARLQQVVTNLLMNAIQFTPERGRIAVEICTIDDSAQVTVSDTGAGIDKELLPHVFDQFKQGAGNLIQRHGGLGLGLAVVRQLIELHGGSVHVASEGAGKGSTFTLRLPRETEPSADGDPGEPVLNGVHVLVADGAAAEVSAVLEASGADVTVASTRETAAEASRARDYDVMIGNLVTADLSRGIPVVPLGTAANEGALVRAVLLAASAARSRTSAR